MMLPTSYASDEMKTAYYITLVPEWFKTVSAYSWIGLIVILPVYYSARLHRPALLKLYPDHISITGTRVHINIPTATITKVFCNDLHNILGKPKGILQLVIQERRHKLTTFRMKNYEDGEKLLNHLIKHENIQFAFYEDNMTVNHEEE
jgi:hypothetical protein